MPPNPQTLNSALKRRSHSRHPGAKERGRLPGCWPSPLAIWRRMGSYAGSNTVMELSPSGKHTLSYYGDVAAPPPCQGRRNAKTSFKMWLCNDQKIGGRNIISALVSRGSYMKDPVGNFPIRVPFPYRSALDAPL